MPHLSTVGWGGMDMTDKGNAPGPKKPYANAKYAKWLTEDGLILLRGWARNGLTDEQIAHNCGITSVTLREWKKKLPSISSALKEGKEVVDILVENALLKRALGYEYIETTHERVKVGVDDDGQPIYEMALTKTVTKMVMPDTTAQIFWLKNRKKAEWRDNAERLEIEREKLELDKRLTEAQIAKINSDIGADDTEFVIGFDEEIETNGWSK